MCDAHRRRFLVAGLGLGAIGLAAAAAGPGLAQQAPAPAQPGQKWICPPCGCAADDKEFDAPGACPSCGMPLIRKPDPKASAQEPQAPPRRP